MLGPGSDGYHEDHIHLDLMERRNNYKICQWNVWDPMPPVAPLLPAERPEEAPPREVAAKSDAAKSDTGKDDVSPPQATAATCAANKKAPENRRLLISLAACEPMRSVTASPRHRRRLAAPSAN